MARTIVGRFDNEPEARRAVNALAAACINASSAQVIDADMARQQRELWTKEKKGGGFWSWLFGDVEQERGSEFTDADDRYYDEELDKGGALVTVTVPDDQADRVVDLLEQRGGDVERDAAVTGGTARAARSSGITRESAPATGSGQEKILPETEEQVRIGKRAVERGVRVYTHVTDRPVEEHIRLREERIKIERRPADRPVQAAAAAFRDQTIELKETVEEPIVEKTARVVGEVVVSKDVSERDAAVRDTVRKTEVQIDRDERGSGGDGYAAIESDFRRHCITAGGLSYDQAAPAYGYGYEMGGRASDGWTTAETDVRRGWEQDHPGTWERFKESIRYAWDRARSKAHAA